MLMNRNRYSPQRAKKSAQMVAVTLLSGSAEVNRQAGPIAAVVLPEGLMESAQSPSSERAQLTMASANPGFVGLMNEVFINGRVGLMRFEPTPGRWLAAMVLEGKKRGVVVWFDPHSPIGRRLLRDWDMHGNMAVAYINQTNNKGRSQLVDGNGLVQKLLATPAPEGYCPDFRNTLLWMHKMAPSCPKDKQRLFVMLQEFDEVQRLNESLGYGDLR